MKRRVVVAALSSTLLLAGCGGGKPKTAGATPPPAAAGDAAYSWRGRGEVAKVVALLDRGKPKPARKILAAVLKRQPAAAIAERLLKQIDTDPHALLGGESFAYVTRPQETFAGLAQRFLGDANLFYALARYNDVAVPETLAAGTTLRIPGREKHEVAAPPPPTPRLQPVPPRPAPAPPPRQSAKPVAPPPRPAPTVANPARAAQLRAAALEQMNRGAISRAVALLAQASRLDPANPLIRRDLDRAARIQRTVRDGH